MDTEKVKEIQQGEGDTRISAADMRGHALV